VKIFRPRLPRKHEDVAGLVVWMDGGPAGPIERPLVGEKWAGELLLENGRG